MNARQIIEKRREMWESARDIEKDREYIEAVARFLVMPEGADLREEIHHHPELLIEMVFVIVDKKLQTVPFFLNEVQRSFIEDLNRAIEEQRAGQRLDLKFLVLKGRQQGFTSLITAYQLACSITRKNFAGFTLADSSDNTETIFEDKAKFPITHLGPLKPTEKYNTRRELLFERLNSKWRVATAGSKDIGRSKTLNFFHGSEVAFWSKGINAVMTGLGQALTKDSIQILETTPNGFNEFKDLWDGAVDGDNSWEPKFYQWWLTKSTSRTSSPNREKDFKKAVQAAIKGSYDANTRHGSCTGASGSSRSRHSPGNRPTGTTKSGAISRRQSNRSIHARRMRRSQFRQVRVSQRAYSPQNRAPEKAIQATTA